MSDKLDPKEEPVIEEMMEKTERVEPESTVEKEYSVLDNIKPEVSKHKGEFDLAKSLSLLVMSAQATIDSLDKLKTGQSAVGDPEHLGVYRSVLEEGLRHTTMADADTSPFDRPEAQWSQRIEAEGGAISNRRVRVSNSKGTIKGEAAALRARAVAKLGGKFEFVFPRTGMHLTLRSPSDLSLMELERRMALEKITLGRSTLGAALTSSSLYMQQHVLNSVFAHVVDGSYKDLTPQTLKRVFKVTDIPILIGAFASTIWTDGYPLSAACTADVSKCTEIIEAEVSIPLMYKVDNFALNDFQKTHLSKRNSVYSDEALEVYYDNHQQTRLLIKLNDEVSVVLEEPTIELMEESTYRWVESVVDMAEKAFGEAVRGRERDEYISNQGKATSLRRFAHWVKEIQYDDGDTVVDDRSDIETTLNVWSSNDKLRVDIKEAIIKYIKDIQIAAYGYARFNCPACGADSVEGKETFTHLPEIIPVDVLSTFFTLLRMRAVEIVNRTE